MLAILSKLGVSQTDYSMAAIRCQLQQIGAYMEFSVKGGSPEKQRTACIVVGVYEPRRLSGVAEQLDKVSEGFISNLLRRGDLEGKSGQMLLLHNVPNVLSERVLLV